MDDATEEPALARAREMVARCLEPGDFFATNLAFLHPDAGYVLVRWVIKRYALSHPLNMTEICVRARGGWGEADLALRELIAELVDRGERLPTVLGAYNLELIHPRRDHPGWRGRKKAAHVMQDIAITVIVLLVVEQFGLKPTRRQSTKPSACSIVARVLADANIHRGGERAIEKIWQRLSPMVL